MVIVCLSVVLLLSAAIVRNLVFHQRQARAELQQIQAFWLAESALDRATVELQADSQYAGTEWEIEIAGEGGARTAWIRIQVESDNNAPRQREVHVVARWPDDPVHRHVQRRTLVVNLADPGESP